MADRIVLNTISYHGHGAIENIVPELTARGYKKAFVCSDPDLLKFGVTKKVTDLLDAAGFAYSVYSEIKPNPTIQNVQDGVAAFKAAEADCIVTIGGGSSMDTAKAIGIIMLTARTQEMDKVTGLMTGADDYVTKPFIADELLLRIDAHVRRHRGDIEHARKNSTDVSELVRREPCRIGDLEVFFDRYEVHLHGEAVPLTAKEFEILALLAESPGEVFTRRRIYEHLWGEVAEVDENSITVFMRKIREKIEDNPSEPRYLLTVWRVGYKLAAE